MRSARLDPQLAAWQGSPRSVSPLSRQIPHMQEPFCTVGRNPFLMAWVMYLGPSSVVLMRVSSPYLQGVCRPFSKPGE